MFIVSLWSIRIGSPAAVTGRTCFRKVTIVTKQVLDAAIGRRQQPKHDTAGHHNAEADVKLWLPRNHTLNSLFIARLRTGRGDPRSALPRAQTMHYSCSASPCYSSVVAPLPGLVAQ